MNNVTEKQKRPSSITLISVFGVYGGLLLIYFIFTTGMQKYGIFDNLFFGFGGIGFIVCGIGFWFMRKWAVYAYAVFAFIDQIALLMLGRWNIFSLLISIVIVYVGYKHLSKMT